MYTHTAQKGIHTDFFARRNFTQNSFYTAETLPHRSLYGQFFLCTALLMHSNYYRHMVFTQKVLRTERFTHNIFLHTDAFIHRFLYTEDELHTETCAHSTLLHATSFYTERFCFPFLITYLSCWPTYGT